MPVAPNLPALKARLDRYFWANRSAEMAALHTLLTIHFGSFDRLAVIGGLVRDFAREGREGFRSDVDLVIEAPADHVTALAKTLGAVPNRFGGYGFFGGPWRIDFWAVETTWAVRYAGVPAARLEDVIRYTFFDWDAVAYNLRTRRLICSDDYLGRIREGILDVNFRPTPSREGNLLRSMRRLVLWRLRVGTTLRSFIDENLDEESFQSIQAKERRFYGYPVTSAWANARAARRALLEDDRQGPVSVQLKLGLPEPPFGLQYRRANEPVGIPEIESIV